MMGYVIIYLIWKRGNMTNEEIEKLANDHWEWFNGLFQAMDYETYNLKTIKYVYITAMLQGYKHGYEDRSKDL